MRKNGARAVIVEVHTWRSPRWARALAVCMAIYFAAAAVYVAYLTATGALPGVGGGWSAAVLAGWMLVSTGYTCRSRITLTPHAVIVRNALRTHTIALTEITDVAGSFWGLRIFRQGRVSRIAGAAPHSKRAVRAGTATRSGQIAYTIVEAARHQATASEAR